MYINKEKKHALKIKEDRWKRTQKVKDSNRIYAYFELFRSDRCLLTIPIKVQIGMTFEKIKISRRRFLNLQEMSTFLVRGYRPIFVTHISLRALPTNLHLYVT